MAEEFTFANVRRAVGGIARYVAGAKSEGRASDCGARSAIPGRDLLLDGRGNSCGAWNTPWWSPSLRRLPLLPTLWSKSKADGVINFTASHNPPEYNGIKFSTPDGCPALPEITKKIEAEIEAGDQESCQDAGNNGTATESQRRIARREGRLPEAARRDCGFRCDPQSESASLFRSDVGRRTRVFRCILAKAGVKVDTVHDYRDVLFGGHAPEPDDHLLEDLREKMRATDAHIGIATDGDADRFGIVDADGTFLQPNYIIALLVRLPGGEPGMEKWRSQVSRDDEFDQCDREGTRRASSTKPR